MKTKKQIDPAILCNEIAEAAALEYETATRSAYFAVRPAEKHKVLVCLIRGARTMMEVAIKTGAKPNNLARELRACWEKDGTPERFKHWGLHNGGNRHQS